MAKTLYYLMILFFPVTSVVLTNRIQGITLSFVFFTLYFLFYLILKKGFQRKFLIFILFLSIYIVLTRYLTIFFDYNLGENISTISDEPKNIILLRNSQITQVLYLLYIVFYFYFFITGLDLYNKKTVEKVILYSLILFLLYGYWELIGYTLFSKNVDFFSNRMYGDHPANIISYFRGLRRMDSFSGEPSMYVFTLIPFIGYFFYRNKPILAITIIVSIILSTSSSAIVGLIVFFISLLFFSNLKNKIYIILFIFLLTILFLNFDFLKDNFVFLLSKLTLSHDSGINRFYSFNESFRFFKEIPLLFKFIGVGFGTIRSTDMFSTLLVNIGIIGLMFYSYFFFKPIFILRKMFKGEFLISSILSLYIVHMVSVPEFTYLSTWIFLGIVYYEIKLKRMKL